MKKYSFLFIATLFSVLAFGQSSFDSHRTSFSEKQNAIQKAASLLENAEQDNLDLKLFTKALDDVFQSSSPRLKSSQNQMQALTDKSQKIDSLLVERWNENTGQLEPSQLERWTWHENGLGKSWELYDLDSLTEQWYPNDKEEYDWDNDENKILHVDYDPDTITGGWLVNAKEIRSFDAHGNQISYLLQFLNRATEEWENNSFNTLTFDTNGNKTENLRTTWDKTNKVWVNSEKEVLAYNDQSKLLRDEFFEWDTIQNNWVSTMFLRFEYDENGYESIQELVMEEFFFHALLEYVYDSNGNQLEVITSMWDFMSNTYVYSLKNTHTYSIDGNELSWSHYGWDASSSDWLAEWESIYKYDEEGYLIYSDRFYQDNDSMIAGLKYEHVNNTDGNVILTTRMTWELDNEQWLNNYKENYDYDSEMRQNYMDKYNWDTISDQWVGSYNEIHEYDISGNFLLYSKQIYDTVSEQWLDDLSDEYSYDLSHEFSDVCYPDSWPREHLSNLYSFEQYTHAMLQKVYLERINDQMETTEKFTFYYSENMSTGDVDRFQPTLNVYPNPASAWVVFDIDYVSGTLIELYNLRGQKVLSQELSASKQLSINHLDKGLYLYRIIQGANNSSGKIKID